MLKRVFRMFSLTILLLFAAGFIWPEQLVIPVKGAAPQDWNKRSFWAEPWGKSGVHKGIDIFAKFNTPVLTATDGIVLFSGNNPVGGNVLLLLGPKWRLHYYAHLNSLSVDKGSLVSAGETIGRVGNSGNAKGRPPHLHYAVITLIPYVWRRDDSTQGWKKMFFLDPGELLSINRAGKNLQREPMRIDENRREYIGPKRNLD